MALATRHWDRHGDGGLEFTEIGLGTAPIGNLYRAVPDAEAESVMAAAWEAGIRHFDTAPLYGLGLAETRLNRFLRGRSRDEYVLSTKVGRLLRAVPPGERTGIGKWFDVPARAEIYDYGYDAVMRSLDFSLERLGVERVDILYAHDLDVFNHGSLEALQVHLDAFMEGGYRALHALREQGVIRAFGAGINEWQSAQWMAERGDFDLFLLAGRYTLLEQESLESFLPLCVERGIGVVVGGAFNSGILATGPRPGAFYNYDPAPPEILERVARIEGICARHGVPLPVAAIRFPLCHPAIVSVLLGSQRHEEMTANIAAASASVPADLWAELKAEGLLRPDAPTG